MNLVIDLSPTEAAQLTTAAQASGLTLEAFVKKLLHGYLPSVPEATEDLLDRLLERRQTQDGTILRPIWTRLRCLSSGRRKTGGCRPKNGPRKSAWRIWRAPSPDAHGHWL